MNSWITKAAIFLSIILVIVVIERSKPAAVAHTGTSGQIVQDGDKAPEIVGAAGYLNTNGTPITIREFQGKKVVLLDIMTYSCINCQRTFPYLNDWYEKYKDQGLVIIGIHTPEFEFEKDANNVQMALNRFGIKFPVVLDNDYGTWNAYQNRYWPRKYLIDKNGKIIFDHIGEGGYEETENKIREALGLNDMQPTGKPEPVVATMTQSPETYIGSARRDNFFGAFSVADMAEQLARMPKDTFALFGTFTDSGESVLETAPASLAYHFDAGKVFLVAGASAKVSAKVYLDGSLISKDMSGSDVIDGTLTIQEHRLYNIVDLKGTPGVHTLRIEFQNGGASLFAFTFGA